MAIYNATDQNFNQLVEKGGLILMDFWAPWCRTCRVQSPVLDQLDKELGDKITIAKVNVDENPSIASHFGIRSIPTIRLIKNKRDLKSIVGVQPLEALKDIIRPYL